MFNDKSCADVQWKHMASFIKRGSEICGVLHWTKLGESLNSPPVCVSTNKILQESTWILVTLFRRIFGRMDSHQILVLPVLSNDDDGGDGLALVGCWIPVLTHRRLHYKTSPLSSVLSHRLSLKNVLVLYSPYLPSFSFFCMTKTKSFVTILGDKLIFKIFLQFLEAMLHLDCAPVLNWNINTSIKNLFCFSQKNI